MNALAVGYARPSVVFPSRYAIYSTLVIAILYLTLNEIGKGSTSRLILTCAAVWIFIGSTHQSITAPFKLKYYVITVKNYEKHLVLNKYFKDNMNQEQASHALEAELRYMGSDPLVTLLPDSHISRFIIHSNQNTFKIMHGNFAYTSPFSNSLKAADKLKVYEIGNMLPKLQ